MRETHEITGFLGSTDAFTSSYDLCGETAFFSYVTNLCKEISKKPYVHRKRYRQNNWTPLEPCRNLFPEEVVTMYVFLECTLNLKS